MLKFDYHYLSESVEVFRDFKIIEITTAYFVAFLHSKADTHYVCFEVFHKVLKQELFNGGCTFTYNSVKQTFDKKKWIAHERW